MLTKVKFYRIINILSLDIVAGAMVSALFFARILEVELLPFGLVALGLTVWIIYTADHLRDAKRIGANASSVRHRVHFQYFKILLLVMAFAIILDAVVILFMRKAVLMWGLALIVIVLAYLFIQRYLKWAKEIFVAILYTCGVLLPSISVTPVTVHAGHIMLFVAFAITALINLLILSWFDHDTDLRDHQHSFATIMSKEMTAKWIYVLIALNLLLILSLAFFSLSLAVVIILAAMNLVLSGVFLFSDAARDRGNYRIVVDAVFLFPVIYLL